MAWRAREEEATGFHTHRHTSLLTCLRTHGLTRLVPAQHPEPEARLLPPQVHLHVLIVGAYGETDGVRLLAA